MQGTSWVFGCYSRKESVEKQKALVGTLERLDGLTELQEIEKKMHVLHQICVCMAVMVLTDK